MHQLLQIYSVHSLHLDALMNVVCQDDTSYYQKESQMVILITPENEKKEFTLDEVLSIMEDVNNRHKEPRDRYYSFHIRRHYPEDDKLEYLI